MVLSRADLDLSGRGDCVLAAEVGDLDLQGAVAGDFVDGLEPDRSEECLDSGLCCAVVEIDGQGHSLLAARQRADCRAVEEHVLALAQDASLLEERQLIFGRLTRDLQDRSAEIDRRCVYVGDRCRAVQGEDLLRADAIGQGLRCDRNGWGIIGRIHRHQEVLARREQAVTHVDGDHRQAGSNEAEF